MPRFSDLLGGGHEGDEPEERAAPEERAEHEERVRPAAEPPGVRETPEDILDQLTSYATAAGAREHGVVAAEPAPSISLEELPPVDDDLLPPRRRRR